MLTSFLRNEARSVLQEQSALDPSEIQYLLEYYSLVRDGKTNYISTTAFHDVTGQHPLEPPEFFHEMKKVFEKEAENGNHEDGPPGKKRKVAAK
jgi:Ca2+-binding EF-hand superfamily protein